MIYSYNQVAQFATEIGRSLGVNIEMGVAHHTNWNDARNEIESLRPKANIVGIPYLQFVMALARAKFYLIKNDSTSAKHKYLDDYIKQTIDACVILKRKHPEKYQMVNLSAIQNTAVPHAPQPSATTHTNKTNHQQPDFFDRIVSAGAKIAATIIRDPEVSNFINSKPFKNLVKYKKEILTTDTRSHSYLFGLIDLKVNKAEVLGRFIDKLQQATTMYELHEIFADLYQNKKEFAGAYQILNTGQNITTRFFGGFGMKTSTITLIEELALVKNSLPVINPYH